MIVEELETSSGIYFVLYLSILLFPLFVFSLLPPMWNCWLSTSKSNLKVTGKAMMEGKRSLCTKKDRIKCSGSLLRPYLCIMNILTIAESF
jgi:hypothetical protein